MADVYHITVMSEQLRGGGPVRIDAQLAPGATAAAVSAAAEALISGKCSSVTHAITPPGVSELIGTGSKALARPYTTRWIGFDAARRPFRVLMFGCPTGGANLEAVAASLIAAGISRPESLSVLTQLYGQAFKLQEYAG
jgi:hypothetical protein